MGESGYARLKHRLPGVEMTEVEVHMATYSLFATDHVTHSMDIAHRQYNLITTVVEVASGTGHA